MHCIDLGALLCLQKRRFDTFGNFGQKCQNTMNHVVSLYLSACYSITFVSHSSHSYWMF